MTALDLKKKILNCKAHNFHQCIVLLFVNTVNCAHGVHTDKAPEYHRLS